MRHLVALALAAGGLTLARPALAQDTSDAAGGEVPTCASQGVQRVAVMVPPGQTAEQLRETLRAGGLFPAGTQVMILQPGQLMPMRNPEQFRARLQGTLGRFLETGIVEGTAQMLLEVDEDGVVTTVHPNSGNNEVNMLLVRTWRVARFEPYVFGGCRVKAWIQVPQTFASNWSLDRREVEVRTTPAPTP